MQYSTLRKKKEIERLFKIGKSRKSKFFILKYCPDMEKETKLMIVVSKKISKLAVIRNRCKRKTREAIRNIGIRKGFDYSMVLLSDVSSIKQAELVEDAKRLFGLNH